MCDMYVPTAPLVGTTQSLTATALTLLPTAVTTPTPSVPLPAPPARSALVTGAASMLIATSVSPSDATPRRAPRPPTAAAAGPRARRSCSSEAVTRAAAMYSSSGPMDAFGHPPCVRA